ncbi:MAG: DUF4129 domain-containing protein [Anaerolineaceae bacterium]
MQKRAQALLYLSLVFVGLLILAGGLPNLEFQPALPIPGAEGQTGAALPSTGGAAARGVSLQMLLQTSLGLGFIFLLVLLIFSLVRKANLKKLVQLAAGLAAVILLMVLVGLLRLPQPEAAPIELEQTPPAAAAQTFLIAPIGDPPAGLMDLVLAAVLVSAASLGGWLLYRALRPATEDPLGRETAAALRAIEEGQDLRDVILTCYLQMTKAVQTGRGLERDESMTPREFEELLGGRGVPADPIHRLTALFEKVRYGHVATDSRDEQEAVDCLNAIRLACAREGAS